MAEINYVLVKGGFHTPTDEDSVRLMLRGAESTTEGMPSIAMRGFRKGIVDLRALNLEEFARLCKSTGHKLTIQIE